MTQEAERREAPVAKLKRTFKEEDCQRATEVAKPQEREEFMTRGVEQRLSELDRGEEGKELRDRRLLRFANKSLCWLSLVSLIRAVCEAAIRFGQGSDNTSRILSYWPYLMLSVLGWLVVARLLLFRGERLEEVFTTWTKIRRLFATAEFGQRGYQEDNRRLGSSSRVRASYRAYPDDPASGGGVEQLLAARARPDVRLQKDVTPNCIRDK